MVGLVNTCLENNMATLSSTRMLLDTHDTNFGASQRQNVNQVTFDRLMHEITDMRVLSIHQNRPLDLDQVVVQRESMRMLSVREGYRVLEQDVLERIVQKVPYLEGLGVNCDSFRDLHKNSVRNTGLDGARRISFCA